jgi:predicted nuclease of predicted toxin-antitoxin system
VTLRFLLDENISYRVAQGLRERDVEAASVRELGRLGLADEGHLAFATGEGRVLVTYNRADFQALDVQWRQQGRSHAGILWCTERMIPRRDLGEIIRAVAEVSTAYDSLDGLCLPLTRSGS